MKEINGIETAVFQCGLFSKEVGYEQCLTCQIVKECWEIKQEMKTHDRQENTGKYGF